jgi:DNA-binding response OmpR family regulator
MHRDSSLPQMYGGTVTIPDTGRQPHLPQSQPMSARILVADDEPELNALVCRQLAREGYDVTPAFDGVEALRAFDAARFDLVILDWMLPKLDGLGVLQALRARHLVPVLMLTARGTDLDVVNGLEAGADDYLVKPVHIRVLRARVRALLRRSRAAAGGDEGPGAIHRAGDLLVDTAARTAEAAGAVLHLSPTEFALLALFVANPGRAFSRDYLVQRLWPEESDVGHRTVDTNVLRLRKKLGPTGDAIRTVWGTGYRLEVERA